MNWKHKLNRLFYFAILIIQHHKINQTHNLLPLSANQRNASSHQCKYYTNLSIFFKRVQIFVHDQSRLDSN